ncbi:unnamed protein product [Sphagnum tenellum]
MSVATFRKPNAKAACLTLKSLSSISIGSINVVVKIPTVKQLSSLRHPFEAIHKCVSSSIIRQHHPPDHHADADPSPKQCSLFSSRVKLRQSVAAKKMHKRIKRQSLLIDEMNVKLVAAAAEESRPSHSSTTNEACSPVCITLGPEPTQCS